MSFPEPLSAETVADIESRVAGARRVVEKFADRLQADLGRVDSSWKSDGSRITETDLAISAGIIEALNDAFPEDICLSEELATATSIAVTSRFSWVLDPIDGTNNFALGLAQCAISLALCENGEPVYGILYDASRRVVMHGGPGFGTWDGERPVGIHEGRLEGSSPIGFHSPRAVGRYPGHGEAMITSCKVRALGSSALHLAYVAAGLLEGVVDHNVKIWDIAAGIALVRGAGGDVEFISDSPLPLKTFDLQMPGIVYVGGGAEMRKDLIELLRSADQSAPGPTAV